VFCALACTVLRARPTPIHSGPPTKRASHPTHSPPKPKVIISYLEIYNEVGYDLLDPAREVAALEDMPQVFLQEDEEGRLHLRNLSSHRACTEEEALNLVRGGFGSWRGSHQSVSACVAHPFTHHPQIAPPYTHTPAPSNQQLFLGDTNRTISETPMNQASSRSHCVFTIELVARRPGEDRLRRSKLNLVDLAGSERVGKTGSEGTVLKEAK